MLILNLLNEFEEKISCEALPRVLSISPNELNEFTNTRA